MPLNPNDPDVQMAVFGEQVEQFMRSDVGVYLTNRARSQADEYAEKLKNADPYDGDHIVLYQMKIHVADLILQWLGEAIAMGLQAREQLANE
jgi:hypothetical protein